MNIIRKLTLRHLKSNKGRSIVTILGIIISVAMITAVFVSIASFLDMEGQQSIFMQGKGEVTFLDVPKDKIEAMRRDDRIDCVGVKRQATSDAPEISWQVESEKTGKSVTGDMYTGDTWNLSQMILCDYEGNLPLNSSEIAVEESLIEKNELDWKIGDIVTLNTGVRYIIDHGERYQVSGRYYNKGEQFESTATAQMTITAILHDNTPTRNYDIIQGMSAEEMPDVVSARVSLKKVDHHALKDISDIAKTYDIESYSKNSEYLVSKGAFDASTTVMAMLPMMIIILVLIMIASVMLIYNAFGMSLAERVRYLGMLASVGATKRQKRASVYFEGFILGLIGIPVGIAAGILGIGITLKIVGDKIVSTGMLTGVSESSDFSMRTVVPIWAIIGIIISVITIFISSYIPAKKASKIMPIDAIRQTNEIKVSAKKLHSPKLIRWIFGYEGELAYKNMKRNGRKARVITISIMLSVVLFLCVNYFSSMFLRANDMQDITYQVQVYVGSKQKAQMIDDLEAMPDVKDVYSVTNHGLIYEDGTDSLNAAIFSKEYLTNAYKNLFKDKVHIFIKAVDQDMFNEICEKNHIDSNAYYKDTLKGLLVNNISHRTGGSDVFNDSIIGQKCYFDDINADRFVEIGALIPWDDSEKILKTSAQNCIQILVPESMFFKDLVQELDNSDDNVDAYVLLGVETDAHASVAEAVQELFEKGDYQTGFCMDMVESQESMRTVIFVMNVFIYGFIVLISLITIANIINTISTGIAMRRKEFAMLRSVGMTPGGFRKMIRLESLLYGIRALIVALPLSVIINIIMNRSFGSGYIPYEFDWLTYIAVIVVVFILISVTMLFSVSKLKKDSIVETLKEEVN